MIVMALRNPENPPAYYSIDDPYSWSRSSVIIIEEKIWRADAIRNECRENVVHSYSYSTVGTTEALYSVIAFFVCTVGPKSVNHGSAGTRSNAVHTPECQRRKVYPFVAFYI